MRRLPRTPLRVTAVVAGVALCAAVAVLAATGTFTGGTTHAKLSAEQRLHATRVKEQQRAALQAAERQARKAARRAAELTIACRRSGRIASNIPAERYSA